MKKIPKLNNKGFAVSVILYAAIILIVLILFLILSILSTITKNKIQLVDSIKEEASGNVLDKTESLGELTLVPSDGIITGSWHKDTFTIKVDTSTPKSFPVQFYYGTSEDDINTQVINNETTIDTNTTGTTYYFRACRDVNKTICTKVSSYLVKLDKAKPSLEYRTGESASTFLVKSSVISKIETFQYYVSISSKNPREDDDIQNVDGRLVNSDGECTITIDEDGKYLYIRGISNSGLVSDWYKIEL